MGKYPEEGLQKYEKYLPKITDDDMKLISEPIDIYGQNIYNGQCIRMGKDGHPEYVRRYEGFPKTAIDWPVTPECLNWGPRFLYERYKTPIYITENGMSCHDVVSLDGKVHDPNRIDFLARYLDELKKAATVADIRGYFQWSLMDNFEWSKGYSERFGLIYIDYQTQQRILKDSAYWYKDYIKNVASSEIYSTWPRATIEANVLAIQSFTLNRVYTEWYRNKGYSFTITSSTAYDQKFMYGRNIYQSISDVVDEMFQNYLSRPNVRQPILTQYCDGQRVTCSNWLSQWGSKYLGDQNYETIEILRYYYGNNMFINTAEEVSGIPASWPRVDLSVGSTGEKVRQIQEQLARISRSYPAIPTITPDGIYGPATREAVERFQSIFGLPVTGVIDFRTWYRISEIYVAVTRIAELV